MGIIGKIFVGAAVFLVITEFYVEIRAFLDKKRWEKILEKSHDAHE